MSPTSGPASTRSLAPDATRWPVRVCAGRLSAELTADGWLRELRYGDTQVLDGIGAVVRDGAWGTIPGDVEWQLLEVGAASFRGRLVSDHSRHGLPFTSTVEVAGTEEGLVTVTMTGHATAALQTNRIGLVVLHPMGAAGQPCLVTHADGTTTSTEFPREVSPHQVFRQVAALELESAVVTARVQFTGDVFETEDQRNWSDASFKTYSRPLELPVPYALTPSDTVTQAVTVSASSPAPVPVERRRAVRKAVRVERAGELIAPSLGLPLEQARERAFGHVRVTTDGLDLDLLAGELAEVRQLGAPVALAVRVCRDAALADVATVIRESRARVIAVMVSSSGPTTTTEDATAALLHLRPATDTSTLFFAGTEGSLAELNRNRFDGAAWAYDGAMLSLCPQLHDHSDAAVMQSLDALPDLMATARAASRLSRVALTPVTLLPGPIHYDQSVPIREAQSPAVDPRTCTSFGASWALAAAIAAAEEGAALVTLFAAPSETLAFDALSALAAAQRLSAVRFSAAGLRGALIDEQLVVVNTQAHAQELIIPNSGRTVIVPAYSAASYSW